MFKNINQKTHGLAQLRDTIALPNISRTYTHTHRKSINCTLHPDTINLMYRKQTDNNEKGLYKHYSLW